MITAAILTKMAQDISELELDKNAFWEELPLRKDGNYAEGVWIVTRGGNPTNAKGINCRTTADIYVGFSKKTKTEEIHAKISEWIRTNLSICELSGTAGGSQYSFTNIRIRPTTTPTNQGATKNGVIVKMASATIYYDINQ